MRLLFIHQNMPGQFRHLAGYLGRVGGHQIVFLTKRDDRELPGVIRATYKPARAANPQTHHYLHQYEDAVLHGQAVARACFALRRDGFAPDLVIAHPGWGESLFVKDVFGDVPLLNYGEYYYRAHGADADFDPADPLDADRQLKLRARNAHLLLSLDAADHTLSPTEWQKSLHPAAYHDRISVIFDGVDTATVRPNPAVRVTMPNGAVLSRDDEVVTYVARTLEPIRGFPSLMRALPLLLQRRPAAHVIIVGGDEVNYGRRPPEGQTWREIMLAEIGLDPAREPRVHFVGRLPYEQYLALLQVSAVHVYLTMPFVLSWSAVEALAAECLVVGSRTAPVEEVIEHGENGLLVDFFSPEQLADTVAAALADRGAFTKLRRAARQTVFERYSLERVLPRQLSLIEQLAPRAFARTAPATAPEIAVA